MAIEKDPNKPKLPEPGTVKPLSQEIFITEKNSGKTSPAQPKRD